MWINAHGDLYQGDCVSGDREATAEEIAAWAESRSGSNRCFSSRDFLKRFTKPEQLAVVTSTMSNAQVKLLWDNLLAADYIDLADPEVGVGLDYLISEGLINAERKVEVLS